MTRIVSHPVCFKASPTPLNLLGPPDVDLSASVIQALGDGLAESVVSQYGRRVRGDDPLKSIFALIGNADEVRVIATNSDGMRELRAGEIDQGTGLSLLKLGVVELEAQRLQAGPVYAPHPHWTPTTAAGESLAATLMGRLLGDALDQLLAEQLATLTSVQTNSTSADDVAAAIAQNASPRLFRRDADGRPRGLVLAAPSTINAWLAASANGRASELAAGRLCGLELVPYLFPEAFPGLCAVVARDRLLWRADDIAVDWGYERGAEFALVAIRVSARADVKIACSADEALAFTITVPQG